MSVSRIYSIIRCRGPNAARCICDNYGMFSIHKIKGSDDDQIVWFSESSKDFQKHVDEKFLLEKLEELSGGKVYEDCRIQTNNYKRLSATIKCFNSPRSIFLV